MCVAPMNRLQTPTCHWQQLRSIAVSRIAYQQYLRNTFGITNDLTRLRTVGVEITEPRKRESTQIPPARAPIVARIGDTCHSKHTPPLQISFSSHKLIVSSPSLLTLSMTQRGAERLRVKLGSRLNDNPPNLKWLIPA